MTGVHREGNHHGVVDSRVAWIIFDRIDRGRNEVKKGETIKAGSINNLRNIICIL